MRHIFIILLFISCKPRIEQSSIHNPQPDKPESSELPKTPIFVSKLIYVNSETLNSITSNSGEENLSLAGRFIFIKKFEAPKQNIKTGGHSTNLPQGPQRPQLIRSSSLSRNTDTSPASPIVVKTSLQIKAKTDRNTTVQIGEGDIIIPNRFRLPDQAEVYILDDLSSVDPDLLKTRPLIISNTRDLSSSGFEVIPGELKRINNVDYRLTHTENNQGFITTTESKSVPDLNIDSIQKSFENWSVSTRTDLASGSKIWGSLKVKSEIGQGTQGKVYSIANQNGKLYITKESSNFKQDLHEHAVLDHLVDVEGIIKQYGSITRIDAQGTKSYLSIREHLPKEFLNIQVSKENSAQLLNQVNGIHLKGMTHNDIHIENIRLRDDNTPAIIDFGNARLNSPIQTPGSLSATNPRISGLNATEFDIHSTGIALWHAKHAKNIPDNYNDFASNLKDNPNKIDLFYEYLAYLKKQSYGNKDIKELEAMMPMDISTQRIMNAKKKKNSSEVYKSYLLDKIFTNINISPQTVASLPSFSTDLKRLTLNKELDDLDHFIIDMIENPKGKDIQHFIDKLNNLN